MNLDADLAVSHYLPERHWRWVRAPVLDLAGSRYHPDRTRRSLEAQLRRELTLGRCWLAVDAKDPVDTFVAVAVLRRDAIVWAFTRPGCRHQGVARWLLAHLGVDLTKPTGVVLWTPMAERLARKHETLYPL